MDIPTNKIMRLVQMGLIDEAMQSSAIWLCASCVTCTTRCPKGVDVAHVMETLRQMAKDHNCVAEKNIDKFHTVWMNILHKMGSCNKFIAAARIFHLSSAMHGGTVVMYGYLRI